MATDAVYKRRKLNSSAEQSLVVTSLTLGPSPFIFSETELIFVMRLGLHPMFVDFVAAGLRPAFNHDFVWGRWEDGTSGNLARGLGGGRPPAGLLGRESPRIRREGEIQ